MVTPRPLAVAVLGLGEAGSVLAADLLAAGAAVRGYDPAVAGAGGITGTGSEAEAASGADLVLSVNSAKAALDALRAGRRGLRPDALWADLNTASPGTKRQLAELGVRPLVAEASRALHQRLSSPAPEAATPASPAAAPQADPLAK